MATTKQAHGDAMTGSGSEEGMNGFQLEDAVEIIERRRWWILLAAMSGLVLGFLSYLVLPAEYQSTTTILVEPQGVPESYIKSTVTLAVEQRLHTLHERVTSYTSLNSLIDRIGTERLDESGKLTREALMNRIRGGLTVEISGRKAKAPVFELTYQASDPQTAALVVREIAALFISENLKDRARQATATAEFLDKELDRLRDEVTEQEGRIRAFNFAALGSLPSQLDTNLREMDRLNLALSTTLEAQIASTQRITMLRRQLGGVAADGSAIDIPGALSSILRAARQELLQAKRVFTDEHPNVRQLRSEIENIKREIAISPTFIDESSVIDPIVIALRSEIDDVSVQLDTQKRSESRIHGRIAELQARIDATPAREQEHQALTRDYENLASTYRSLLGKKYEAALARNLELAQKGERFKLLRPAQIPSSPTWPDLAMLLPAGLGFGLVMAGFGIGLAEYRNPAFRSVERLTRMLGIPVFASIPRIDNDQIFETPPNGDVDPKLVAYTAPESSPAEQYRGFLPTFLDAEDCKVILVTSAARGDGKTLTTMNLAVTLATDLNKRVLVIDGDLRRPNVHRIMRVDRRMGLSTVLRQEAVLSDCTVNSKIYNVTVLPAGGSVRNPLALLTDSKFLEVIEEARAKYDVVLIDSPPLLPVVDSKILRKMADMVLFVVRADSTPREAVVRSMKDMRDVAGVIFNQVSPGSFRRYYYYDAYSRYAYGDPISEDADETVQNIG